jgi:hypothetical protein
MVIDYVDKQTLYAIYFYLKEFGYSEYSFFVPSSSWNFLKSSLPSGPVDLILHTDYLVPHILSKFPFLVRHVETGKEKWVPIYFVSYPVCGEELSLSECIDLAEPTYEIRIEDLDMAKNRKPTFSVAGSEKKLLTTYRGAIGIYTNNEPYLESKIAA